VTGKAFKLAIVKIPASPGVPYKGVLFVSFFSPPFVDFIGNAAFIFQQGVFAGYDIIAWDPRGNGHTTPLLKCFLNPAAETAYAQTFSSDQFTPLGAFNGSFPPTDKNLKANLRSVSAAFKQLSDGCINFSSEILP
jgi:pimeloyl-ACP methyl ester carboxylesterase